ncbi:hypothetical protein CO005_00395 [Candidatus Roizmanbacteria bacterium CG_4_8_14_3_um_filter_34_9]|uniref:Type II toxin-antitoxin system HicA family toxin n=2 Tax=Candidatus Roizmaniibacteriota TaxID=1752723 RepID=A0A2M6YTH7_9BACT|nr:MAG: hypothetical protein COT02_04255 [Candidatus Roizmanbacteria bacterium CG07_land_8_20_14_0_80_34_15]PIW73629.1 MAG: hypothetical protein CO005_00395 [Candidatus Roizmanbacteria bacterium CG_4_8_14_3_um_filter_34_9]
MKITPVHYKKLCFVFEKLGWSFIRQKGDHLIYEKQGFIRPVVIPMYKTIPVFIIKNNLRTAKISREEYLEILRKS